MLIGLTGPNASGKGEAALYIKAKGFSYDSLSDILREEAKKKGIETSREKLIELGNEARRKNGPSVLALRAIERLPKSGNHIIDSIRNPAEVEALKAINAFTLIGIDCPVETRFKRAIKRKRTGAAQTLREFVEKEKRENKADPSNQQLEKCLGMADTVIINDSTLEEFHKKIDAALKKNQKT
ncbi:MAG: AAA family ATPase [Candidatus Omnitrophota bacterium]